MAIKLKIRSKLLLSVLGSITLIYCVSFAIVSVSIKRTAYRDVTNYIDAYISENANITMGEFNADMIAVRTLAQAFENYEVFTRERREAIVRAMYEGVFKRNPQFYALWDSWELSAIDPNWKLPYGRTVENFWRDGDTIKNNIDFRNLNGDSGDYERIKRDAIECAEEPYYYSFTGRKEDEILMSSFISPIKKNGRYIGIVGIDISLEHFQKRVAGIQPYPNSYAFLLSYQGVVIAHPNKAYINKSMRDIYNDTQLANTAISRIQRGEKFSFVNNHYALNKPCYFSFAPIKIGESKTPWSMGVAVPIDVILHTANRSILRAIVVGLVGLIMIVSIIWIIAHNITQPLIKVARYAKRCSMGDFGSAIDINRNDEIGDLAKALAESSASFMEISAMAKRIARGDLSHAIDEQLGHRSGDLIVSLQQMVERLRTTIRDISLIADDITSAADLLNNKSVRINKGGDDQDFFIEEVSRSMHRIGISSEEAVRHVAEGAKKVSGTVNSLKGIIGKTRVIDDIYMKTNFIALNAAVEAARAGEYGRGFSVVAKEIQKLAEQSKTAATDIDKLSKGSIKIAEESLSSLRAIVDEIQQTAAYIKQVIDAGADGKRNGNVDLVRLKEITNENHLISKEIATNAELLAANAKSLKDSINYFRIE